MIKTDDLRGIIAKNGLSQTDVAKMIGVTPKTFYEKMKNGVFGSDEIQIMIDELHIENPMPIFLPKSNLIRYFVKGSGYSNEQFSLSEK